MEVVAGNLARERTAWERRKPRGMNRGRGGEEEEDEEEKRKELWLGRERLLSNTTQLLRAGVSTPRTHKHKHTHT